MASSLASSSKCVLGGGARVMQRVSFTSGQNASPLRGFGTTALRQQTQVVENQVLTEQSPVASTEQSLLSSETLQSTSPSLTAANDEVSEQASRKAFYDNLQANARQAKIDEARNAQHLKNVRIRAMQDLGSSQTRTTAYRPHHERLDPLTARQLTVSHLLAATAHVGHAKSSLSRASAQFVYGVRHGQTIIDVEKYTLPALRLACKVVKDTVYRDGVVVFVGTAEGTEAAIIAAAKRLGKNGFHVAGTRWLPGTLSNASNVMGSAVMRNAAEYDEQIQQEQESKQGRRRPKTARDQQRLREEANAAYDPANLTSQRLKPDLMIIMNPKSNKYAINEATQAGVPTIGVIDTDVDPRLVTYAIPANDESIRTAELIVGLLSKAGQEGVEARRMFDEEQEKVRQRMLQKRFSKPFTKPYDQNETAEIDGAEEADSQV